MRFITLHQKYLTQDSDRTFTSVSLNKQAFQWKISLLHNNNDNNFT